MPALYYSILVGNLDMVKMILSTQQTMLLYFWTFVFAISLCLEYRNQEYYVGHAILVFNAMHAMLMVPLIDCAPKRLRGPFNKLIVPPGIALLLTWQVALFFK
jgi:hypothetical protein